MLKQIYTARITEDPSSWSFPLPKTKKELATEKISPSGTLPLYEYSSLADDSIYKGENDKGFYDLALVCISSSSSRPIEDGRLI